ncbi:MAG: NADH-quinone oxidoreductase subunit J [Thermodesulfobacteriota bacterium]
MTPGEWIFIGVLATTLAGSLAAVLSGSVIYALFGLVTAMFGMGGIYIYLGAPFLAMMQILIYVGAITILIAFAVMLAGPMYRRPKEWTTGKKLAAALAVVLFSLFVPAGIMTGAFRSAAGAKPLIVTTEELGRVFLDRLTLPFELISLLIVVSIIGAIMLALFSKERK